MSTLTQDPGPGSIPSGLGVNMWAVLKAITQNGVPYLCPLGAQQVFNNSGADITTDKLVALVAGDSLFGVPLIVLANAGTAGHENVYVTRGTIQNGAFGIVYECSLSGANLNTNSFSGIGATVYLNTVSGGFTQTPPSGSTQRVQPVGTVVVKSATVGQIFWCIGPVQIWGSNEIQPGAIGSSQIGANSIGSGQLALSVIQTVTGQIASAAITGTSAGQLGNANGVTLVAAAGAKIVNRLISAIISMDFATAAYTGGGNTTVNIGGGGSALTGLVNTTTFIQAASDVIIDLVPLAATNLNYGTGNNSLALVTSAAPTQPGTAAGVINYQVTYQQIAALID